MSTSAAVERRGELSTPVYLEEDENQRRSAARTGLVRRFHADDSSAVFTARSYSDLTRFDRYGNHPRGRIPPPWTIR